MTKTDIKNIEIYEELKEELKRFQHGTIEYKEIINQMDKVFIKLFKKGLINIKGQING